jgi:Zn-dependent protease with chaperone function
VGLKSGSRGSVKEADIVGLRLHQKPSREANTMIEALEILHIEIGSLKNFERSLNYVKSKFNSKHKEVCFRCGRA